MTNRNSLVAALVAAFASACGSPTMAAAQEVLITQAKALAGNITPGDAPGYPITISKTGTYRLASNLTPDAGKDGISFKADFVTIDMAGFTLNGGNNARVGIYGSGKGARIQNGSVANFKSVGIEANGDLWTIENMLVTGVGGEGMELYSMTSVLHSIVANNAGDGILCSSSCQLEGNIVSNNGHGIILSSGAVRGNVIMNNEFIGLEGDFNVGYGENTIEENNKSGSQADGMFIRLFPNACDPGPCP